MVFNRIKLPPFIPAQDGFELHHQLSLTKVCSSLLQKSRRVDKFLSKKVDEFEELVVGSLIIQMSPDTFKEVILVVKNFWRTHPGIFAFFVSLRAKLKLNITVNNKNEPC